MDQFEYKKIIIDRDPYEDSSIGNIWSERGRWPCRWISGAENAKPPFGAAYSRNINLTETKKFRIHVTADERYELFLDGKRIGRGPERGDPNNWFYESYELELAPGEHNFTALVWSFGEMAPYAQMSVTHGFMLAAENDMSQSLNTGVAEWESQVINGINFIPYKYTVIGPQFEIDGSRFPWGIEKGLMSAPAKAKKLDSGMNPAYVNEFKKTHLLRPAMLPEQLKQKIVTGKIRYVSEKATGKIKLNESLNNEVTLWENLLYKGTVTIEPGEKRCVIIDLDNYYCAYPELTVSRGKGAKLNIAWAEALFTQNDPLSSKLSRNEIDQRYFIGIGDSFFPDGAPRRKFRIPWWRSGRYIKLTVSTGVEPLRIDSLKFFETRYPLDSESSFNTDNNKLTALGKIALRTLQMCLHETYMDCPYYEQLMYLGDARLQMLANYTISRDSRPAIKAIKLIKSSILPNGLTQSRYPSRFTQIIPPFSLWWVGMVHDHLLWRGNKDFIREIMPSVRYMLDSFSKYLNKDGVLDKLPGWNFVDWAPEWCRNRGWGMPPEANLGVSGVINWQYAYTLRLATDLHSMLGNMEIASLYEQQGRALADKLIECFYDEKRGLFADTICKTHFSEHSQCLAILSGYLNNSMKLDVGKALLRSSGLTKTTVYFSHYLFETFAELGAEKALFDRLTTWLNLGNLGLKTLIEEPEPSRSDCHAWSAHPLYHFYATVAGVKPVSAEFKQVAIRPMLGPLNKFCTEMVHPAGKIKTKYCKTDNGNLTVNISLPAGIDGELNIKDSVYPLVPGDNNFTIRLEHYKRQCVKSVSKKTLPNINYLKVM